MRQFLLFFVLTHLSFSVCAQNFPTEISAQYGPETGISGIMPKVSYRSGAEGQYWGISVSWWVVAVSSFSIAPCYGYRHKGMSAEVSAAFTFVLPPDGKGGRGTTGFYFNVNPKVMLGHRIYAGFGPGFYLYRRNSTTKTLWDDAGRYNFELGYSERLRF
jgi:hypothetical protein